MDVDIVKSRDLFVIILLSSYCCAIICVKSHTIQRILHQIHTWYTAYSYKFTWRAVIDSHGVQLYIHSVYSSHKPTFYTIYSSHIHTLYTACNSHIPTFYTPYSSHILHVIQLYTYSTLHRVHTVYTAQSSPILHCTKFTHSTLCTVHTSYTAHSSNIIHCT